MVYFTKPSRGPNINSKNTLDPTYLLFLYNIYLIDLADPPKPRSIPSEPHIPCGSQHISNKTDTFQIEIVLTHRPPTLPTPYTPDLIVYSSRPHTHSRPLDPLQPSELTYPTRSLYSWIPHTATPIPHILPQPMAEFCVNVSWLDLT